MTNFVKFFYSAMLASLALGAMAEGEAFQWKVYEPAIVYDFAEQGVSYSMPTKNVEGDCYKSCGNHLDRDWWSVVWGKNNNSVVTETAISNMLNRFNEDFNYITDSLGWPRDQRAREGYRSTIFIYGSDGCTGSNDNTELGGWQTWIDGYPAVNASYYPVYSFDPACPYHDRESQMSAMVHEGIHCVLASLGARHVHWAQEGGDTWLQQEMEVRRSKSNEQWHSGMGFLNAGAVIAPFIPIECYSGWLLDGSFGGPGAQGVGSGIFKTDANGNMVEACNWRNTIGGYQYGNMFFTFLGEWVSTTAVPWIWGNCNDESKYILETISNRIGDTNTRMLIMEYRAKLALCDMKKWSQNCRTLMNDNFGVRIKEEWQPAAASVEEWSMTPYAVTTNNDGVLTPENRTTPGWSGANIIPLKVSGKTAKVELQPIGDNMSLQLCYRATDGTPVYSKPVFGAGTAALNIEKEAQSGVIFAVVCNTDYKYEGDATRKKHHDYRLKLVEGIAEAADPQKRWYNDFELLYDWEAVSHVAGKEDIKPIEYEVMEISKDIDLKMAKNYEAAEVDLIPELAEVFGITAEEFVAAFNKGVKMYGVKADGSIDKSAFTANNGYWLNEKGEVCAYADEGSTVFAEFGDDVTKLKIGHFPDRVSEGKTYTINLVFQYSDKQVNLSCKVTIKGDLSGVRLNESAVYENLSIVYDGLTPIINYTVPFNCDAKLSLYTAYGALIKHLDSGVYSAGDYSLKLDLGELGLSKGIYLVKLSYSGREITKVVICGMK